MIRGCSVGIVNDAHDGSVLCRDGAGVLGCLRGLCMAGDAAVLVTLGAGGQGLS